MDNPILALIKAHTKTAPIRSSQIERTLGMTGSSVRDTVRELRRQGIPICAIADRKNKVGGYFYSEDPFDIAEMLQDLKNRRASLDLTIQAFESHRTGQKQLSMF